MGRGNVVVLVFRQRKRGDYIKSASRWLFPDCVQEQRTEHSITHLNSPSLIPPYKYPVKVKVTTKPSRMCPRLECQGEGKEREGSCGKAEHGTVQSVFPCRERETKTQGLSTTCCVLSRTYDLQSKSDLSGSMLFANVQGRVSVILLKLNLEMSGKKTGSLYKNPRTSHLRLKGKISVQLTFLC